MKASLRWLREYATLDAPVDTIVRALVDTGTEVGATEPAGAGLVVSRIAELAPLAGSRQGLLLATVDVGGSEMVPVVTGAPNVRVGDLVPYAPPGTRPPGMDEPVTVRQMRNQKSVGMLCSAVELGTGADGAGLLVLERGTPGQPLAEILDLDTVLDIEVTTNRPDCLCHVGIARELAAALPGDALREPDLTISESVESAAPAQGRARVRIEDSQGCPRFAVRVIEGVVVRPSPEWLQRRLRAVGLRPINNVVDVTNFVTHELGQPLHAFDLDRFIGAAGGEDKTAEVVVRRAAAGERLRGLDGVERVLSGDDLVVCAGAVAASLGGVIGGADTAVDEATHNVLLEAASWDGPTIRATSRRLGVRTDASNLFEKGLSDTLPPVALDRAAALIASHAQGHILRGSVDEWPGPLPQIRPISVTAGFISDLLGVIVDATEAATVLAHLGFALEQDGATLVVVPPHFRRDVTLPEDIVEEVGRMLGYARVPSTLPGRRHPLLEGAPPPPLDERVREICVGAGYDEAITFAFVSADAARLVSGLGGARPPLALRNPLSDEWSVLRVSQLPGLCRAIADNLDGGVSGAAMFELGRVFWADERAGPVPGSTPDDADAGLPPLPAEPLLLSVAVHVAEGDAPAAASAIRNVQSLFADVVRECAAAEVSAAPVSVYGLRSGRAAELQQSGRSMAIAGELDRVALDALGIRGRLVVGELNVDAIAPVAPPQLRFPVPPQYPGIVQDLAVTVPLESAAGAALTVIRASGAPLLADVDLYDEYRGDHLAPGRKGWTFRLTFRAPDRTLTGAEAQHAQDAIVAALRTSCGAELRA